MQRLLVIVALLFGFAAVAAPAMASAKLHAPQAMTFANAGAVDLCIEAAPVLSKVVPRACTKTHKGIPAGACHQFAVIPAAVTAACGGERPGERLAVSASAAFLPWPGEPQLRPPRGTVIA